MGGIGSTQPDAVNGERIRAFMHERGFRSCDSMPEIEAFHRLGASLIPVEVATPATIAGVQERTGSSVYLKWEDGAPSGFLAFFAFSKEGEAAVTGGDFVGTRVKAHWVEPPSPETRMGYVWGFGGISKAACFAVIRTGRIIRDRFFPHLSVFARAATPDGRKVMEPLGYRLVSQTDPGFYFSPPFSLADMRTS